MSILDAYQVVGAEINLRMGPTGNVLEVPENLWAAATLARNVRLQHESDKAREAQTGSMPVRGWNEDAE